MIEIVLTPDWGAKLDVEAFINWIKDMGITNENWNFTTTGILANPKLIFVHEDDAVAFKLKFL